MTMLDLETVVEQLTSTVKNGRVIRELWIENRSDDNRSIQQARSRSVRYCLYDQDNDGDVDRDYDGVDYVLVTSILLFQYSSILDF